MRSPGHTKKQKAHQKTPKSGKLEIHFGVSFTNSQFVLLGRFYCRGSGLGLRMRSPGHTKNTAGAPEDSQKRKIEKAFWGGFFKPTVLEAWCWEGGAGLVFQIEFEGKNACTEF